MRENQEIKIIEGQHRGLGYAQEFRSMIREHPGVIKTALELTQKAADGYNPSNIPFWMYELGWNNAETRWDVVKKDDKDIEPYPYTQLIWGRGTLMKAGEILKDDSGLEVTPLGKTKRVFRRMFGSGIHRLDESSYFKVSLDGKTFFVKKSTATTNPGVHEFNSSVKAREALKDLDNVEVVDAQLGYADKNQSWFVSKWADLESKGFFSYDVIVGSVPDDYGTPIPQEVMDREHRDPIY